MRDDYDESPLLYSDDRYCFTRLPGMTLTLYVFAHLFRTQKAIRCYNVSLAIAVDYLARRTLWALQRHARIHDPLPLLLHPFRPPSPHGPSVSVDDAPGSGRGGGEGEEGRVCGRDVATPI